MAWTYLAIAGVLEIAWAIGLKYTDGFKRFWPSLLTAVAVILSFYFLAQALRSIPIGTAYAVWTGIGAAGTAIYGMAVFGESRDAPRVACIALIIAGVAGLQYFSNARP